MSQSPSSALCAPDVLDRWPYHGQGPALHKHVMAVSNVTERRLDYEVLKIEIYITYLRESVETK